MTTAPSFRAFFGDGEREFRLTPILIAELERKTGAGIGALYKRVLSQGFYHADLTEIVRLALVGGGESPKIAASLTEVYAANRPLIETLPLALSILETAFYGAPQDQRPGDQDGEPNE
jgi:hypothetical protein